MAEAFEIKRYFAVMLLGARCWRCQGRELRENRDRERESCVSLSGRVRRAAAAVDNLGLVPLRSKLASRQSPVATRGGYMPDANDSLAPVVTVCCRRQVARQNTHCARQINRLKDTLAADISDAHCVLVFRHLMECGRTHLRERK